VDLDVEGFVSDGYVAVRGAFDAATAEACREMIWGALGGRGVREDDPAAWPSFAHIDSLGGGGPFAAAGMSPALAGRICMSRSSWRRTVRPTPALMPRSGGRRYCAGRSLTSRSVRCRVQEPARNCSPGPGSTPTTSRPRHASSWVANAWTRGRCPGPAGINDPAGRKVAAKTWKKR
jgi:hypothetical protein